MPLGMQLEWSYPNYVMMISGTQYSSLQKALMQLRNYELNDKELLLVICGLEEWMSGLKPGSTFWIQVGVSPCH